MGNIIQPRKSSAKAIKAPSSLRDATLLTVAERAEFNKENEQPGNGCISNDKRFLNKTVCLENESHGSSDLYITKQTRPYNHSTQSERKSESVVRNQNGNIRDEKRKLLEKSVFKDQECNQKELQGINGIKDGKTSMQNEERTRCGNDNNNDKLVNVGVAT
jgi:hypothetical protein